MIIYSKIDRALLSR